MTIDSLAALAAADTGFTILRIEPTADSPVRPSRGVPDPRAWTLRYAHDELLESDRRPRRSRVR